jgi:hypothetical protein
LGVERAVVHENCGLDLGHIRRRWSAAVERSRGREIGAEQRCQRI